MSLCLLVNKADRSVNIATMPIMSTCSQDKPATFVTSVGDTSVDTVTLMFQWSVPQATTETRPVTLVKFALSAATSQTGGRTVASSVQRVQRQSTLGQSQTPSVLPETSTAVRQGRTTVTPTMVCAPPHLTGSCATARKGILVMARFVEVRKLNL